MELRETKERESEEKRCDEKVKVRGKGNDSLSSERCRPLLLLRI